MLQWDTSEGCPFGACHSSEECSTCSVTCPADPNGLAWCEGSVCGMRCNEGYEFDGNRCAPVVWPEAEHYRSHQSRSSVAGPSNGRTRETVKIDYFLAVMPPVIGADGALFLVGLRPGSDFNPPLQRSQTVLIALAPATGDKKWEKGMSVFCKPFTTAKIRYFDRAAIAEARAWLEQN